MNNRSHLLVPRINLIDHFSSVSLPSVLLILRMTITASIYQQCKSLADFNYKRPRGDKLWKAVAHEFAKHKAYEKQRGRTISDEEAFTHTRNRFLARHPPAPPVLPLALAAAPEEALPHQPAEEAPQKETESERNLRDALEQEKARADTATQRVQQLEEELEERNSIAALSTPSKKRRLTKQKANQIPILLKRLGISEWKAGRNGCDEDMDNDRRWERYLGHYDGWFSCNDDEYLPVEFLQIAQEFERCGLLQRLTSVRDPMCRAQHGFCQTCCSCSSCKGLLCDDCGTCCDKRDGSVVRCPLHEAFFSLQGCLLAASPARVVRLRSPGSAKFGKATLVRREPFDPVCRKLFD
jgi:hypothetical protein